MTIQEFDNRDFTLDELYDLCYEIEVWAPFDEIHSRDSLDDEITEELDNYVRSYNHDWVDVRDMLCRIDIEDGTWFTKSDYDSFTYYCVDDDTDFIDGVKQELRGILIDIDYFENEEEEEEEHKEWFDCDAEPDLDLLMA